MTRIASLSSVAALGLVLAACGPKAEQKTDATMNTAEETLADAGAMASNAAEDVKAAVMPAPTGQEFANKAAKSDAFEIAAAKLAVANGMSADVEDFAAEMIKAHTESTGKIKAAAAQAEPAITPDPALTKDQNDDLAKLAKLKGAEFDKEYIDGQVDAHQEALALMRSYADSGDVPSLKATAGEIAPIVSHHLDMAKALAKD